MSRAAHLKSRTHAGGLRPRYLGFANWSRMCRIFGSHAVGRRYTDRNDSAGCQEIWKFIVSI